MIQKEEREKYIRWFYEIGAHSANTAGGKGANLGEMVKLKMPVPPGFVIISKAFDSFLDETGLKERIYSILKKIDVDDTKELEEESEKIRLLIHEKDLPEEIAEEIIESYQHMSFNKEDLLHSSKDALAILKMSDAIFVAVRSSATAEDSSKASFAGQGETYLNIKGNDNLIDAVKKCWASLFTARNIYYRAKKGFEHEKISMAVVVQKMIDSEKAGVIFSKDPVTNSNNIIIEAVFGLGEGIVSGMIQPDYYSVTNELSISKKIIANKKIALARNSAGKTEKVRLTEEKSKLQVLTDYEIKKLAEYAKRLENHYKVPQDIEFAIEKGEIYLVQTRPITTLDKKKKGDELKGNILISGMAASPGIAYGEVKIILNLKDLEEVKKGNILVTTMTNPDMVVTMQKCAAIVTNEGGTTSHAAIVSREMGIPCIVGTRNATEILHDGQIVTVDGYNGIVYEGKVEERAVEIKPIVKTETEIKVIVDLPDYAERAARTKCKKIGLIRIEGIIASSGYHPEYYLKNEKIKDYEEIIYTGISKIVDKFEEAWIRTSDIRSDEFRNLKGSPKDVELNPMLGMHGIRASLKKPALFKAELRAIKRVAENRKRVGIMLPQIISVSEVQEAKKYLDEIGFENAKLGVMIETPAAVQIINELCKEGIKFISFGTNDLTQFTLAIDRGNEKVQYLYDEMNKAVLNQIAYVIRRCIKYGVETSICGQAGSRKEMVSFLVKQGIDSISVSADMAHEISIFVKELEEKNLRGSENIMFAEFYKKKDIHKTDETRMIHPEEGGLRKLREGEQTIILDNSKEGQKIENASGFILNQKNKDGPLKNFDTTQLIEEEKRQALQMEEVFDGEIKKISEKEGTIEPLAEETAKEISKEIDFIDGSSPNDINSILSEFEKKKDSGKIDIENDLD